MTELNLTLWLKNHPNWTGDDNALIFEKRFENFVAAFGFLTDVAGLAEDHGHHPRIENTYNHVKLTLNTHDAGNKVTSKDLKLAEAIDALLKKNTHYYFHEFIEKAYCDFNDALPSTKDGREFDQNLEYKMVVLALFLKNTKDYLGEIPIGSDFALVNGMADAAKHNKLTATQHKKAGHGGKGPQDFISPVLGSHRTLPNGRVMSIAGDPCQESIEALKNVYKYWKDKLEGTK